MNQLEARLIDHAGAENLGIADLQGMLSVVRAVALRLQNQSTVEPLVLLVIHQQLVARGQGVAGRKLPIQARADVGAIGRGEHGRGERSGIAIGIEYGGADGCNLLDLAKLGIEEDRKLAGERAADIAAVEFGVIRRDAA